MRFDQGEPPFLFGRPTAGNSVASFCDVLTEFIKIEASAQREQHLKHLLRPLEERVIDERCLSQLRSEGPFDPERRTFRFICEGKFGNTARFREGDRLRLHQGDYAPSGTMTIAMERDGGRIATNPSQKDSVISPASCATCSPRSKV